MLFLTEFDFSNLETIIRTSMTPLKFYGRAEISEILFSIVFFF